MVRPAAPPEPQRILSEHSDTQSTIPLKQGIIWACRISWVALKVNLQSKLGPEPGLKGSICKGPSNSGATALMLMMWLFLCLSLTYYFINHSFNFIKHILQTWWHGLRLLCINRGWACVCRPVTWGCLIKPSQFFQVDWLHFGNLMTSMMDKLSCWLW